VLYIESRPVGGSERRIRWDWDLVSTPLCDGDGLMDLQAKTPAKRRLKRSIGMPAVAFVTMAGLLFATSGVAFAQGYARGNNYYYSDIYAYYNWNAIDTTTGQPAYAWTAALAYQNVPAGYVGAKAFMYKSNGSLCRADPSWTYNGGSSGGLDVYITPGCGAGPVYYSQGQTRAFNGTGYDTFGSYPSPNENS
jgi:hypothetical protein